LDFGLKLSEEELDSISSNCRLKIKHKELSINKLWISVREEYPLVAKKDFTNLMQYSTSYPRGLGFSH
jgi:hypothetical protein